MSTAGTQIPLNPTEKVSVPPEATAIANFLYRNAEVKQREGLINGKRQDFFRVKRAFRALLSDKYKKAQAKPNSHLPIINNRNEAASAFRLMPLNRLALRVTKLSTEEAIELGSKPKKGIPALIINPQQEFGDDMYYTWLYEPFRWVTYLYAGLAVVGIFGLVLFPLWPIFLRKGVWYLSMGLLGLLGLFFAMAFFRLILFCITYVVLSPGLWLFPNLFEDVGFCDSFVPLYGWDGVLDKNAKKATKKKKAKKAKKESELQKQAASMLAAAQSQGAEAKGESAASNTTLASPSSSAAPNSSIVDTASAGVPNADGQKKMQLSITEQELNVFAQMTVAASTQTGTDAKPVPVTPQLLGLAAKIQAIKELGDRARAAGQNVPDIPITPQMYGFARQLGLIREQIMKQQQSAPGTSDITGNAAGAVTTGSEAPQKPTQRSVKIEDVEEDN
ncbi:translocation protein [Nadsonia fulvescens var. elongata DSM 6958]|uniref:Translocation protein SEC62 n=1 Tax=Nadsonia fulvescens var. elongata DSM 6958 TaxID=857566 RepID=A0A1E3PEN9_9ASCO|nr:translocation protein [Nadsonia fulvescens var. elongata DSM 6958]